MKSLDLSLFAFVTEALLLRIAKIAVYPLEFPRPKIKTHAREIPHDFFLMAHGLEIPLLFY